MNHNKKKTAKKKEKKNFGMGEMIHCFSDEGRTPSIIEELYIFQITGASSRANSFNILFGNMSGPGDLLSLIDRRSLKQSSNETRNLSGTSMVSSNVLS